MSQNDLHTALYESICDEIKDLAKVYTWETLSKMAGLGRSTLRNAVNQSAHKVSIEAFTTLSTELALQGDYTLLRFMLPKHIHLLDLKDVEAFEGTLVEANNELIRAMHDAEIAQKVNDEKKLHTFYRFVCRYVVKVRDELQSSRIMLRM